MTENSSEGSSDFLIRYRGGMSTNDDRQWDNRGPWGNMNNGMKILIILLSGFLVLMAGYSFIERGFSSLFEQPQSSGQSAVRTMGI